MNTPTFRIAAVLLLALPLVDSATAEARPCPQMYDASGSLVFSIGDSLQARWTPTGPVGPTNFGISDLFTASSACLTCHTNNPFDSVNDYPSSRFLHCAHCHATGVLMAPPDWLKFDTKASVVRNSYYRPGKTKAVASLLRAVDGSMPPGAAHNLAPGIEGAVSWCDEIQWKMQEWINAGYP